MLGVDVVWRPPQLSARVHLLVLNYVDLPDVDVRAVPAFEHLAEFAVFADPDQGHLLQGGGVRQVGFQLGSVGIGGSGADRE